MSNRSRVLRRGGIALVVLALAVIVPVSFLAGCSSQSKPKEKDLSTEWVMGLFSKDWVNRFYAMTPVSEHSWVQAAMITVGWRDVEPQRGQFDWTKLDATMSTLEANGVTDFCFTLDKYLPAWAGPKYGPPKSLDDWRGFVRGVAERYKGKVDYYQIWNEPSRDPAWMAAHNSPYQFFGGNVRTDYPPMLQAAYEEIKAVDTHTMVICAALNDEKNGSTRPEDGTGLYAEMFGPGYNLADFCDAVAVHPYYQPAEWGTYYALLKNVLDGYGIQKELVVTEIGWPHNFPDGQAIQAAALAQEGLGGLVDQGCRKFWVYTDIDDPPGQTWDFDYGLFDYQGNPLPAWNSFKDWVSYVRSVHP